MPSLRKECNITENFKAIVKLLRQGLISEEVALSNLELSKEELDKKIKELNI